MINLLICDDNPEITKQVNELVTIFEKKYKINFLIDIKNSGDFILNSNKSYDIAIVDIEMPGISGLRLSEKLKELNSDIIVIVLTSFQNYLDSAMKIHVFRYLSKPIDKNRFYSNLKEAIEEYRLISKIMTLNHNGEVHLIKTKDILYIENQKYGSIIYTKRGNFYNNIKPKELNKMINQKDCFVFSHNSILVNLQNVIDFNKTTIVLRKNEAETVSTYMSQRKYSNFKKAFFDFAGGLKWQQYVFY